MRQRPFGIAGDWHRLPLLRPLVWRTLQVLWAPYIGATSRSGRLGRFEKRPLSLGLPLGHRRWGGDFRSSSSVTI